MLKQFLLKNSSDTINLWIEFSTFPKGISAKLSVIAWLEFELVYFKASGEFFSHYVPRNCWDNAIFSQLQRVFASDNLANILIYITKIFIIYIYIYIYIYI